MMDPREFAQIRRVFQRDMETALLRYQHGSGAGPSLPASLPPPDLSPDPSGTYGDASHLPQITVDAKGRVTGVSEISFGTVVIREAIFTREGTLSVAPGTIRIYNKLGASVTISQVFIAVNGAPSTQAIIVDVNNGGTTIFTDQAHRPQIAASTNTGYTASIDAPTWADGAYLTMDVDQVGISALGSDLTVHIVYS